MTNTGNSAIHWYEFSKVIHLNEMLFKRYFKMLAQPAGTQPKGLFSQDILDCKAHSTAPCTPKLSTTHTDTTGRDHLNARQRGIDVVVFQSFLQKEESVRATFFVSF